MDLNPANDKVLSFQVICGTSGLSQRVRITKKNFIGFNEMGHKILGRRRFYRQFFDTRTLRESL